MNNDAQNIEIRIENIKNYIMDCNLRVARGENIDLRGLDEGVEDICNEVLAMPSAEAKKFQPHLKTIITALDKLVRTIYDKGDISKIDKA